MTENILRQVQEEVLSWAKQFGDNESKDPLYGGVALRSLPPLLGMMEELGELTAPILKRHQGRGYEDPAEYRQKVVDSLADILIFMCDFANREQIDLSRSLGDTWTIVKKRQQQSWQADKAKEEPTVVGIDYEKIEEALEVKRSLEQYTEEEDSGFFGDSKEFEKEIDEAVDFGGWRFRSSPGGTFQSLYLPNHKSESWPRAAYSVRYRGRIVNIPSFFRYLREEQKCTTETGIETPKKKHPERTYLHETREQTGAGFAEPPEEKES